MKKTDTKPLSILVVDDEALIAEDIRDICELAGYLVCDTAFNAGQALNAIESQNPSLVLLDINLSDDVDGIEIAGKLESDGIPYLFITSYTDEKTLSQVKKLKPLGYIVKPFNKHQLLTTVDLAIDHIKKGGHQKDIDSWMEDIGVRLTQREHTILLSILNGQNTKGISLHLGLSINTVKYHLKNVFVKFDVHSKAELLALYFKSK